MTRGGADGREVEIDAYNSPAPDKAPSRPEPALSQQEMRELVLNPYWSK